MTSFSEHLTQSKTSGQDLKTAGKPISPRRRSAGLIAKMLVSAALLGAACGQQAIAQVVVPGINAPPLVHFPSSPIEAPQIPQANVLPQQNYAPLPQTPFPIG